MISSQLGYAQLGYAQLGQHISTVSVTVVTVTIADSNIINDSILLQKPFRVSNLSDVVSNNYNENVLILNKLYTILSIDNVIINDNVSTLNKIYTTLITDDFGISINVNENLIGLFNFKALPLDVINTNFNESLISLFKLFNASSINDSIIYNDTIKGLNNYIVNTITDDFSSSFVEVFFSILTIEANKLLISFFDFNVYNDDTIALNKYLVNTSIDDFSTYLIETFSSILVAKLEALLIAFSDIHTYTDDTTVLNKYLINTVVNNFEIYITEALSALLVRNITLDDVYNVINEYVQYNIQSLNQLFIHLSDYASYHDIVYRILSLHKHTTLVINYSKNTFLESECNYSDVLQTEHSKNTFIFNECNYDDDILQITQNAKTSLLINAEVNSEYIM